jgi:hypothetical protein
MLKTVSSIANALGALNYKGTWNASTNVPTLASGVGTQGDYYVVSVAGSTDLDGVTNWGVGDWAAFNGSVWQRLEGGADGNFVNLTVSNTATVDGLATFNGNAQFPDNSKAIFGDNDDLQIYSDGSHSYIKDTGTGDLRVYAQDFQIRNADGSNTMLYANAPTGGIQLFHTGLEKLATTATGIDVTGSVTADGLTVDGTTATIQDDSANLRFENSAGTRTGYIQNRADAFEIWDDQATPMTFGTSNVERMRIDASGNNVGIGTSSPTLVGFGTGTNGLEIADATLAGIRLNGNAADSMYFVSGSARHWLYGKGAVPMTFSTNSTEAMRIDASGSLLVGKTSADFGSTQGFEVRATGNTYITAPSVQALRLNRTGSEGDIVEFRKDGVTVGSIGVVNSDNLRIGGTAASHAGIQFGTNILIPETAGAASDGLVDVGTGASRYKDLYLSGGVVFGTTGGAVSSKTLEDYEEGTFTPAVAGSTTAGSATYTIQQGSYTKIGNVVYWQVRLAYTGHTGTGNMQISFPFTSANRYAAGNYSYRDALTVPASEDLIVYIPPSATYIGLYSVALGTDLVAALVLDTAVTDLSISGVCTVV